MSEADLTMLKWLRRQHAAWRSTRVITLIGSVLTIAGAILGWTRGESLLAVFAFSAIGVYGLSYTLGSWAGRPEISLLLKLVEEQQPRDVS